jgi:hypothetical protein
MIYAIMFRPFGFLDPKDLILLGFLDPKDLLSCLGPCDITWLSNLEQKHVVHTKLDIYIFMVCVIAWEVNTKIFICWLFILSHILVIINSILGIKSS